MLLNGNKTTYYANLFFKSVYWGIEDSSVRNWVDEQV